MTGEHEHVSERVRAVWDLVVPAIREYAGVHAYDGEVMDMSPSAIGARLRRLRQGPPESNLHDETHLSAVEDGLEAMYGQAECHRWNPLVHLENLDLACYEREYAPRSEREAARARHLRSWPEAVDGSLESLDDVSAPVAVALLGAAEGLKTGVEEPEALAAHDRLCDRLRHFAEHGRDDAALGSLLLADLLGAPEGTSVDLGRLEERADGERRRLRERLADECERYRHGSGADPAALVAELVDDHPEADGIYATARAQIGELRKYTSDQDLLPELGGECNVGPAPDSRRFAMAMMSWNGAYEEEAPAWYYVNPPDDSWDASARKQWLAVFSDTTLPSITAHEVIPGHFAHGRMIRRIRGSHVRRSLCSAAFVEGWAHYAEELMVEVGFREDDPRFAIGVFVEALLRVTRLAVALGIHRATMTVEEAARRFEQDAFLQGPAARSEAARATFDPTYGRYTWGKLEIMSLRDEAIAAWGSRFSLRRFHEALLGLGAPPLGTIGDAIGD